jgi:hypothetical protein
MDQNTKKSNPKEYVWLTSDELAQTDSKINLEAWKLILDDQNRLMTKFLFHKDPSLRKENFDYNVVNLYVCNFLGDDFVHVKEEVFCDISQPEFYDFFKLREGYLNSRYTTLYSYAVAVAKHKMTYGY